MTPFDDDLWTRLLDMRIGPAGAALTFEGKLACEQGWDASHAASVVAEYRRFLYLAATSPHPVTPSQAVDAAWHLHLTYSRHYWDVLCGQILGRPLHHDPTLGGDAEDARHRDQYARTLDLYRVRFGDRPPPQIWPNGAGPRRGAGPSAAVLAAAGGTSLLAACAAASATSRSAALADFDSWFIPLVVIAFVVIFILGMAFGRGKGRGSSDGSHNYDGDSWDSGSDGGSGCGSSCGGGCGGGGD